MSKTSVVRCAANFVFQPLFYLLLIESLAIRPVSSFAAEAKLSGPITFASPDVSFGRRRPVTAADRAAIQNYRLKKPVYSTLFIKPDDLDSGWTFVQDDFANLKSCRKPGDAETSTAGLRFKTVVATDCKSHFATGSITSKAQYKYGYFEVSMKIADIKGMNNAFWLTSRDHYEIDVGEVQFPNYSHIGLQSWPVGNGAKHEGVGFGAHFTQNLAYDFHDYGLLWTAKGLVFAVDGEPVAALDTDDSIKESANLLLSNALADWASGPPPDHPEGHAMVIRSVRVVPLDAGAN